MDALSKRNQTFVSDSLLMLSLIDDVKVYEKNLEYLIKEYNSGSVPDSTVIFEQYQKIYDAKTKLDDVVSSINMHGWKVFYEEDDLTSLVLSTAKNCKITEVTIPKTIYRESLIPPFNIKLINLGLNAINSEDELEITLSNSSLDADDGISIIIPISDSIDNIMQESSILVETMPCPAIPYEYNLKVKIRNKPTGIYFGEYEQKGINIIEKLSVIGDELKNDL